MTTDTPADPVDRDEQGPARFLDESRPSNGGAHPGAKRRSISNATRMRIGERDGWICCLCGEPVDKDIPWRPPAEVPEHVLTQAAAILARGVDERVVEWVGEDTDRARAILMVRRQTPAYIEHQKLDHELFELRCQLGPYTGTASDARLRLQIAERQIAADAARVRALGKDVVGQPSIEDAVRAVRIRYVRRNARYPSVEHITPVMAGGGDDDANLGIAHHGCNVFWSARGKSVAVENRTPTFLARQEERRQARGQHWDKARVDAVSKFRAAEQKRRADLIGSWTEDDQLRRELRRLRDRLRLASAEEERAKIQNRCGRIMAKREKIQRRINRLELGYRIIVGMPDLL